MSLCHSSIPNVQNFKNLSQCGCLFRKRGSRFNVHAWILDCLSARPSYLYIVVICCSKLACLHRDKWSCCLPQVGSHGNRKRPVSHRLEIWIPSSCWMLVHRDPRRAPSRTLHVTKRKKTLLQNTFWGDEKFQLECRQELLNILKDLWGEMESRIKIFVRQKWSQEILFPVYWPNRQKKKLEMNFKQMCFPDEIIQAIDNP